MTRIKHFLFCYFNKFILLNSISNLKYNVHLTLNKNKKETTMSKEYN